jgi:hypothetical protein
LQLAGNGDDGECELIGFLQNHIRLFVIPHFAFRISNYFFEAM